MFSFLKLFMKLFWIYEIFINQSEKSKIFTEVRIAILKYDYEILIV